MSCSEQSDRSAESKAFLPLRCSRKLLCAAMSADTDFLEGHLDALLNVVSSTLQTARSTSTLLMHQPRMSGPISGGTLCHFVSGEEALVPTQVGMLHSSNLQEPTPKLPFF